MHGEDASSTLLSPRTYSDVPERVEHPETVTEGQRFRGTVHPVPAVVRSAETDRMRRERVLAASEGMAKGRREGWRGLGGGWYLL